MSTFGCYACTAEACIQLAAALECICCIQAKYRRMVCENASTLEQQKELTSRLQHDYNQALERNTQLQVQLVDARRKLELEKQRAASEKKKLEYHIKEVGNISCVANKPAGWDKLHV